VKRASGDRTLGARGRAHAALWPAVQASLAAGLAWLVAHRVLGHADPFFAPIAAAISLGTTHLQRSPRIVQMVLGVLLGIAVGSVFGGLLGASTPALGLTVLATLLLARALGVGFVGDGMMFANQAASSAVLVVVLHHSGTGSERALDAVVGGAVALVVGVLLFPAHPLPRLREAEGGVLAALAGVLERAVSLLRAGTPADPAWTLEAAHEVHEQLAKLTLARSSARANVRVAPRRWRLRGFVDAENRRLARLHLLADGALSVVRAATAALDDHQPLPDSIDRDIAALAMAIGDLASARQPWPPPLLRVVGEVAGRSIDQSASEQADWAPVLLSTLRTTARDLEQVIKLDSRSSLSSFQPLTRRPTRTVRRDSRLFVSRDE
jgi:uncharacterized membrane protein YgaE (UPF0421/DUF939 family)